MCIWISNFIYNVWRNMLTSLSIVQTVSPLALIPAQARSTEGPVTPEGVQREEWGAGSWGARWLTKRAAAKILISCLCLQKLQFFSRVSYDIESQQTGEKGHTTKKGDDFDVPSLPLCAWWSKLFWYCWETWGSKSQQASMAIILRVPLGSRSVTVE